MSRLQGIIVKLDINNYQEKNYVLMKIVWKKVVQWFFFNILKISPDNT